MEYPERDMVSDHAHINMYFIKIKWVSLLQTESLYLA